MKKFTQTLKRNYFIPLLLLFFAASFGQTYTSIPDTNFEQALINLGYDDIIDGNVLTSNISSVISLNLSGKNISSLVGINDFINLKYLDCANNALTSLNISGLTNLWELVANNNLINSLDVSSSPDLYHLDCERNQINSLNISGLTKIQTLIVWVNNLTSLDVHNNPDLTYLDCDENAFNTINIDGLTNLEYFYCSYNQLPSIDVSAATNLIEFNCNDNLLSSMDVRGLSNLDFFDCSNNPLTCILVDNVAAANAEVNWSKDPDPDTKYSYCDCSLTTTWTSALGGSWDNGAPTTGTYAAIISANYNQPANINACSLTITNNAFVAIQSGNNVTLNAPIIVNNGSTFVLNSNANLIQTNKKSINNGDIIVNRESSPLFRLDYTMWSSPVFGTQTLGEFSPSTLSTRFYEYNTATDFYNVISTTSPFNLAKGYLIRMPDNWVAFGGTAASWPGNFTGTPNNGDITFTMSTALNGFNAVGNPYPSTLNMDNFINGNSANISGPLYFWRKTNDASNLTSYSTCTTAGCTSPNTAPYPNSDFISVGQGFIVKATSTTLNFNNTMRVANNTNQFFKTKVVEKNRIWLNLSNDTTPVNQMLIAYMPGASQGIDRTIDGAYFNDSATALNSLIGNEEFAIQGRSLPFDGTDIVPLAFKTDTAGNFTIAIDHVDGLFSGSQDIILKDNTTGTETDLKAGSYTFTATAGTDNTRFSLKYQKTLKVDTLAFNENSVTVYKNKGTLIINSAMVDMSNIKVFDIQGRLIAEKKNMKTTTATINNLKSTNQVLIVKVTSQDNTVVSKKVVY